MLRRVVRAQVQDLWPGASGELGVILVGNAEITRLNESFLRHAGATDVIAFSYLDHASQPSPQTIQGENSPRSSRIGPLNPRSADAFVRTGGRPGHARTKASALQWEVLGEVFVCVEEAMAQAHRYRTIWPVELVRYVVHGLLHLRGFRDGTPRARRRMKREENRRLRALARTFALSQMAASR
jgi:rRNA maturation RNase YbeY